MYLCLAQLYKAWSLNTNLISIIDSAVLGKLINLAILDMANNQLTSFPNVPLPKLATLDLEGNLLTAIPSFSGFPSLSALQLDNNPIRMISPRTSAHLGKVSTVDLRNTEVVEIPTMCPENSLTLKLENNAKLDLCSSKMAWLKQNFFTVTYTDVMCNQTGKMWSNTTFEELIASHPAPDLGDVRGRLLLQSMIYLRLTL